MDHPAHRARIWKAGRKWQARRPLINEHGMLATERRQHDTWQEARDWTAELWPSPRWALAFETAVADVGMSVINPIVDAYNGVAALLAAAFADGEASDNPDHQPITRSEDYR